MISTNVIRRLVPRPVTRRCSLQWVIVSMSAFFSHEYRGYSDVSRHSNLRAANPRPLARNLQASCGVNESFTVIAPEQPCLEGCYHPTNTSYRGLTMFTPSGDYYAWPQPLVRLGEHALGNGSSEVEPWWLIRQQSENSSDVYCFSEESAASVHPSNATWICDLFQEGSYRRLEESEFRVACGCSGDLPQTPMIPLLLQFVFLILWLPFWCGVFWCCSHVKNYCRRRQDRNLRSRFLQRTNRNQQAWRRHNRTLNSSNLQIMDRNQQELSNWVPQSMIRNQDLTNWGRRGWLVILRSREFQVQIPHRIAFKKRRPKKMSAMPCSEEHISDWRSVVMATVELQEEGIFRHILAYL